MDQRSNSILNSGSGNKSGDLLSYYISNLVCSVRLITLQPIPGDSTTNNKDNNTLPHSYSYHNRFPSQFIRLKTPPITISLFRSARLQSDQSSSPPRYETTVLIVGAKDYYMIIYGIYHLYVHYHKDVTFVDISISIVNCVISGRFLLPLDIQRLKENAGCKDPTETVSATATATETATATTRPYNRFHPYQRSKYCDVIQFKLGETISLRLFKPKQTFNVMGIEWETETTIQSPCENAIQKIRDLFSPFVLTREVPGEM